MTDRFNSLFVILEKDIREDDAQQIINAIMMTKFVLDVKGNIANHDSMIAQVRERHDIGEKLFKIIHKLED